MKKISENKKQNKNQAFCAKAFDFTIIVGIEAFNNLLVLYEGGAASAENHAYNTIRSGLLEIQTLGKNEHETYMNIYMVSKVCQ